MPIEIQPYAAERVAAVKAFNLRLRDGGEKIFKFAEQPQSSWLQPGAGETLFEEYFLANDADAVRGGYVLKHQPYWINGGIAATGYVYSPISEGIVNTQFGKVGLQLMMHALRRQPLLYCLGMGGFDRPLPQMLKAMGWTLCAVPFYFRVARPAAFFRNFTYASRYRGGKLAANFLAATGLGWLGAKCVNAVRTKTPEKAGELSWQLVPEFGDEATVLWDAAHAKYSLAAVRDRAALNRLYPRSKEKFLRLLVSRGGKPVGWAVALDTPMRWHKFFGDARLGSVIDCFALAGAEFDVIHAATCLLEERGVDVIVSNQSHAAWCHALRRTGWLSGPSNFIFATAPKLTARLAPFAEHQPRFHLTRGDGEGPTHL
ncbi:MAG: hypothetical protein HY300_01090 [Verrucomicrobia bacterium]|nr:hypothetical protein [Verrucomicrobiota bacterium]